MTTASYDKQPQREKGSELYELHLTFQEQGKRLQDVLAKLTMLGNKLWDESQQLEAKISTPPADKQKLPGIINDLSNCADGYRIVINQIEGQLKKLEGLI